MPNKKPIIAICYDFDGTLSPGNMQEHDFIPQLGLKPKDFWGEITDYAIDLEADQILTYMYFTLKKAKEKNISISKENFQNYGKTLKFFEGVTSWFERINEYAKEKDVVIEHYLISSGIKEMVEGSPLAKHFKAIYASEFLYDDTGAACWPSQAVNYTTKTQFLFRINKGIEDVSDNKGINEYKAAAERRIPFSNIVFIGDGETDIPCMGLTKYNGGNAIAVYTPEKGKDVANKLLQEGRINFIAPTDYSKGSQIENIMQRIVDKVKADTNMQNLFAENSK